MSEHHATNGHGHDLHGMNGNGKNKYAMNAYYASELETYWKGNLRWQGIARPYSAEDVIRLRGSHPLRYMDAQSLASAGPLSNMFQARKHSKHSSHTYLCRSHSFHADRAHDHLLHDVRSL